MQFNLGCVFVSGLYLSCSYFLDGHSALIKGFGLFVMEKYIKIIEAPDSYATLKGCGFLNI